jgi:quinol monooxygenase YgiN
VIVLIVRTEIKEGAEAECIRIFHEVTEATRKEPGCLQYIIHQSMQNSAVFVFYEQYVDQAAVDAHRASPHFARYRTSIEAYLVSRSPEYFVPIG